MRVIAVYSLMILKKSDKERTGQGKGRSGQIMGNLINISGKYSNRDAVDNVIQYITRTRDNEMRLNELRGLGGAGVGIDVGPQMMIDRFKHVQNCHGIGYRGGRRILHEVFSITDREFADMGCDMAAVNRLASELCLEYFRMGFQITTTHWLHCYARCVSFWRMTIMPIFLAEIVTWRRN